jgi:hypothetical protein
VALQDIDFGWDPRALAPDLKSFPGKVHIEEKNVIGKKLDVR